MSSDSELLSRYVNDGSDTAFAELVNRHIATVYSAAVRRMGGDSHLAKDVSQRVFVALASKAGSVVHHPYLGGWLYTAVRNEAANLVRSERRRKRREQEATAMERNEPSPDATWKQIAPLIDALIDDLSATDRRAILLRFMDGKSYGEIGEALAISGDAARMRVERSLERIRGLLARKGIAASGVGLALALAENSVGAVPAGVTAGVTTAALSAGSSLAAVVAIGGSLTGILLWQNVFSVSLMLVALAAAGYEAWRLHSGSVQLRAEAMACGEAKMRLEAAAVRKVPATAAISSTTAVKPPGPRISPMAAQYPERANSGRDFLLRHPELKQPLLDYFDAQTRGKYAGFFSAMGLSADQVARFVAIHRTVDMWGTTTPSGKEVTFEDPDATGDPDISTQMQALLGDDGLKAYSAYVRTLGARQLATNLAEVASSSDSPLTADQAAQVAAIFAAEKVPETYNSFNWDSALAKSQGVLNATQLGLLQSIQAKIQGWHEVTQEN